MTEPLNPENEWSIDDLPEVSADQIAHEEALLPDNDTHERIFDVMSVDDLTLGEDPDAILVEESTDAEGSVIANGEDLQIKDAA